MPHPGQGIAQDFFRPLFQKGGTAHGVSRIDISHEYQYARTTYGLSYTELKDLARASLERAFLDGHSLWASGSARTAPAPVRGPASSRPPRPAPATAPACARHLEASPKAATAWRQEAAFAGFERRQGGAR